jgi:signal transduction histidine kinase
MLADLIDAAISEAVRAYIGARDYEVRRSQAEHVGFLTHELRNPLTTAMHAAELLRGVAGPAATRAIDALDRSLASLAELIDGVLSAERLEAGQVVPRLVELTEGELLERATRAARGVAASKGIGFELRHGPERRLRLDPDLTGSAIQNLVDNAVKYTDHGQVTVTVDVTSDRWRLHVRDTCNGLSAEELRTIFEPYRRGVTNKQGTGLGLSIAKRAIEAQGGQIHAESPDPQGCHFWIELPYRET